MQVRIGVCASCNARFKVPASFQADKARCKQCGDGVVEIGPPQEDAPAPAAQPEAKPAAARPAAPPPKPASPARPAAARRPAPEPEAEDADDAEEAARPSRKRTPARAGAARGSSRRSRRADADDEADEGEDLESNDKPARARGGRSRAGGRGRKGGDKKKSQAPMLIAAVVLVAVLGGGAWWFLGSGEAAAGESAATPAAGDLAANADGASEAAAPEAPAAPQAPSAPSADGEAASGAAGDGVAQAEEEAPKAAAPKKGDPASVDLTALPEFGPAYGTTDEQWAEMQQWVAYMIDVDSGKRGSDAQKKLIEMGPRAFPVVLNAMKTIDYGTPDGRLAGKMAQDTLREASGGRVNFDWKESIEPKDVWFNKVVVQEWSKLWARAETDIEFFIEKGRMDEDEAKALREKLGIEQPEPVNDLGGEEEGDPFGEDPFGGDSGG